MLVKANRVNVIGQGWAEIFTTPQIKASCEGAGLWSVVMQRTINRLDGVENRKPRPHHRPPLADIPVDMTDIELMESLGPGSVRRLRNSGHKTGGLSVGTVITADFQNEARFQIEF